MNLDELQSARDRERQTDKLQQLRATFYEDAGEFIRQLRTERERVAAQAENPLDAPEVGRLTDEIHTAEQIVEALYENRIGKIVKAASLDAAGLGAEVEGMTTEEEALFETLVADIKSHRQEVLAVLDGPDAETAGAGIEDSLSPDVAAADLMGAGEDTGDSPSPAGGPPPDHAESREDRPSSTDDPGEDTDDPTAGPNGATGDSSPDSRDASTVDSRHADESAGKPAAVPPDVPVREDGGAGGGDGTGAQTPELAAAQTPSEAASGNSPARDAAAAATGSDPSPATKSGATVESETAGGDATGDGAAADDVAGESDTFGETGTAADERMEVRVTEGIETFVGVDDRDYDLAADDVVSLPAANATLLLERDVAEPLE